MIFCVFLFWLIYASSTTLRRKDVSVVLFVDSDSLYAANCLQALRRWRSFDRVLEVLVAPVGTRSLIQRAHLEHTVNEFNRHLDTTAAIDSATVTAAKIVQLRHNDTAAIDAKLSVVANAAVAQSSGTFVLFLHDSVELLPSAALHTWIARLNASPLVGAISAPLVLPDRRTVHDVGVAFALEAMRQETEVNWWDRNNKQDDERNTALPHVKFDFN